MKISALKAAERLNVDTFDETVLSKALSRVPELGNGVWLAGGAIRRTFEQRKLDSDFDFFFQDEEAMKEFCSDLEKSFEGKLLAENSKNKKYIIPSKIIENDDKKTYLPEMEVQVINFRYFENPEEVIDSFDFTICQFAFDGTHFYIGDYTLWDLARKKLVINKITYGVATVRRLIKYANQGFTACGGCLTQILKSIAENPALIQSDTLYID